MEEPCDHKVLRKVDKTKWLSPVFCQGKSGGSIRLLIDLRKLSERLQREDSPLETIYSMLNSMGNLKHTTTLDQVMRYCTMQVEKESQTHIGVTTPWQTHTCNALPHGVKITVDFYQREMVKLNSGLDRVKMLLDETSALDRTTFDENFEELDEVLTRMETSGFQVSI